jgi:hypothetical protein
VLCGLPDRAAMRLVLRELIDHQLDLCYDRHFI